MLKESIILFVAFLLGIIVNVVVTAHYQTVQVHNNSLFQMQNYATTTSLSRELLSLNTDPLPEYKILYTFPLNHTDGGTTSLNFIEFATSSAIGGFVTNGQVYIHLLNYQDIKPYGEPEKSVPEVNISVLVHELWHLTTKYNLGKCTDVQSNKCQEFGAYNMEGLMMQIIAFSEDNLLRIAKN